jgi:anti-sigma regulatory factor (Ser/Thr protein kinase)
MRSQSFPARAASIPAARRYVAETLDHLPVELRETAALLVSELATNTIRHAGGRDFEVTIEDSPGGHRLWVGVTDYGPGHPVPQRPAPTAEHGRGLQLVGSLADRWGVRRRRATNAKTVWFELSGAPTDAELAGQARRQDDVVNEPIRPSTYAPVVPKQERSHPIVPTERPADLGKSLLGIWS